MKEECVNNNNNQLVNVFVFKRCEVDINKGDIEYILINLITIETVA